MGSEWTSSKLESVVEHIADNRGKNPKAYSENGIPVIDNYLITSDWRVDLTKCRRFINNETFENFIRKHIQEDDVLVTLVGNGYGQVAITPEEKCVIIQNTIGLRCDPENDCKYLYYLLKGNREALMNLNIGAAQPSIKVGNLMDLTFRFPPLPEQKAIAHILGTLDDKIELNRKMNATLEAMAQALFKSWFVDFDPVIDNALAAGNPIPEELAPRAEIRKKALGERSSSCVTSPKDGAGAPSLPEFPAAFQFTDELGYIPEGWDVKPLADQVSLTMGQSPSSEHYNKDRNGLPFHQGVTNYGVRFPTNDLFTTEGNRHAKSGDILFSVRAPVGRINIANCNMVIGRGLSALRHKQDHQSFLVYFLKHTFQKEDSIGSGTIFNAVNKKEMEKIPLIVAPDSVTTAFDLLADSWDSKIASNASEADTLTKLRDTLLPKLISGELRISN